jgi:hypothetical protein
MTFEDKVVEDKTVKELLSLLEGIDPETVEVLRDRLQEIEREICSAGYSAGLDEGVRRATIPDESFLLRGEAKGLVWASHAASGGQMAPNTNPYVSPRFIERLLAMGEKAKAEKAKQ